MTPTTAAADAIRDALTLSDLCDTLNDLTPDEADLIDYASLPTYGGPRPADTAEIYSWDTTHLLTVTNVGRFELTPR